MNVHILIKNHPIFLSLLTIAIIVVFSFGRSTGFALWQDDNGLIFKLQHLEEPAGFFGAGPLGMGAYRYIAVPYIPIYELFGANIPVFYIWAIFFYFLASVAVFFLALEVTKSKFLAFLSGTIFAAGFIGSDGILRLFNSIQTSYSVVLACLLFIFLWRFIQRQNARDYLVAVLLFFVTLETAFIRTQYLFLPTVVFLLLFLDWGSWQERLKNVFLITPFLFVYRFVFSYSADARAEVVKDYITGVLSGKFEYAHSFFAGLGNIVLPQPIANFLFDWASIINVFYGDRLLFLEIIFLMVTVVLINLILKGKKLLLRILFSPLPVFWFFFSIVYFHNAEHIFIHSEGIDTIGVFANFVGGLFLILQLTILFAVSQNREKVKLLIFLLSWMLANILAFSTYLPFSPFESVNRYLVHSLAAYALIIPIYVSVWKRVAVVICGVLIFANVMFSIDYQQSFIADKSVPTNKFYEKFRHFVPEVKKGSVFYFDVANDPKSQQEFRDSFSVASMPDSTAIAIRYGIDRYDFTMTRDFNEYLSLLEDKTTIEAFSFFYSSQQGLVDTTNMMRANLSQGKKVTLKGLRDVEILGLPLITPAVIEFSARINPKITPQETCSLSIEERKKILTYILSRDVFLKSVNVKANSEERLMHTSYLTDGKFGTLWRGNRGLWHDKHTEEIFVDLGSQRDIGQLVWVNGYANSTPVDYRIEISTDGKDWNNAKNVVDGGKKGSSYVVEDNFPAQRVRYIKFIITKTFDNDSPAIFEIEAVGNEFINIDKENLKKLEGKSYCVQTDNEVNNLEDFISMRGIDFIVSWETDKVDKNIVKTNLKSGNSYFVYQVVLPAGGTKINRLKIESELIPSELILGDIKIIYPNKEELVNLLNLQ